MVLRRWWVAGANSTPPIFDSASVLNIGVVGTGVVGSTVVHELNGDQAIGEIVLLSGTPKRHRGLAAKHSKIAAHDEGQHLDAVVICVPDHIVISVISSLMDRCKLFVCTSDVDPEHREDLEQMCQAHLIEVVFGANVTPGLTSLLASHAADLFDEVSLVSIAVSGTAGSSCRSRRAALTRSDVREARCGEWYEEVGGSGLVHVWFPPPINRQDCVRAALLDINLVEQPKFQRVSDFATLVVPPPHIGSDVLAVVSSAVRHDEPGAIRVDVQGTSNGIVDSVAYACVDRPSLICARLVLGVLTNCVVSRRVGLVRASRRIAPVDALQVLGSGGVHMVTPVFEL